MGKWAEKFGTKFEADARQAQVKNELALNKQRAVTSKQQALWTKLQEDVIAAVNDVNSAGGNPGLVFSGQDLGNSPEFGIMYARVDEQRRAKAKFNPSSHVVMLYFEKTNRQNSREFTIVAKDDLELEFSSQGSKFSIDGLIDFMFSQLL